MWLSPPKLSRHAPLNVVYHGNSLIYGEGSTGGQTLGAQAHALLQASFQDVSKVELGHSGWTWQQLDSSGGDADTACVQGKANVLVCWETTNSLYFGRTVQQTIADAQSYVANRLAIHAGWRIVVLGTLPRQRTPSGSTAQADVDAQNAALLAADAGIRANCCGWGAGAFVDLRCPGSPFRFPDFTSARFGQDAALWNEADGSRVHLTNAGYAIVAGLVARAILNLAAR